MLDARYLGLLRNAVTVALMTLVTSGCLLQEDVEEDEVSADAIIEKEFSLSGSVGDGPVVTADMRVIGADASVITSFVSDTNAQYQVTVDVADYTAWRDNIGTGNVLPNDTTPETVDLEDYRVWQHFFASSAASATLPIPEPTTVLLQLGLLGSWLAMGRTPFRRSKLRPGRRMAAPVSRSN